MLPPILLELPLNYGHIQHITPLKVLVEEFSFGQSQAIYVAFTLNANYV